jgi:hypothetical protein
VAGSTRATVPSNWLPTQTAALADGYSPRSAADADARDHGAGRGIQPDEPTEDCHPDGAEAGRHVVRLIADSDRLIRMRDRPDD